LPRARPRSWPSFEMRPSGARQDETKDDGNNSQ
jgi:hypothetical protein